MREETLITDQTENTQMEAQKNSPDKNQRGSAIVISLLIMALLMVFVAVAMSRTTSETIVMANDGSEGRTYAAAEAALDITTRNFNKIFDFKLVPDAADLEAMEDQYPPGMDADYEFNTEVEQVENNEISIIPNGSLQGLYAQRSRWSINTIARERSTDVKVELRREYYNNLVPIFQFGIFYDDDLEFHPGPRFDFGGRVHSNGNLYLMAQTGLYFSSRVTAQRQILTQKARNGSAFTDWGDNVWVRDGAGVYRRLYGNEGSALHNTATGPNLCAPPNAPADSPACYRNNAWATNVEPRFDKNLQAEQNPLNLPLAEGGNATAGYIEMIRRGREANSLCNNGGVIGPCAAPLDNAITARERYANKTGIRISLSDSKARLPGCASGVGEIPVITPCGVRLDGERINPALPPLARLALLAVGSTGAVGSDIGYDPASFPMTDNYRATRLNGNRFRNNNAVGAKTWENTANGVWIKIELTSFNPATASVVTRDVTADILSLGITEAAPRLVDTATGTVNFEILGGYHDPAVSREQDSRSIVQLQRFVMRGPEIRNGQYTDNRNFPTSGEYNYVLTNDTPQPLPPLPSLQCNNLTTNSTNTDFVDKREHKLRATVNNGNPGTNVKCVVPFPIQMFDTREGLYNDSLNIGGTFPAGRVSLNGVMSLVQINVGNLRRFINGEFDGSMPQNTPFFFANGNQPLRSTDVPQANGYVLYVSDRRGDADFDGEYDMEDIFGNNNGALDRGEDVNRSNALEANYDGDGVAGVEAPRYADLEFPDAVAVLGTKYYRRGVRLVNGETIPGFYDSAFPGNTRGFTVSSENAVYVQGNYNATGVAFIGSPTPATQYLPQNTANHIPASISADTVMILSNNWLDSRSFRFPFALNSRPATQTTVRFAMISGDALSTINETPNQGGGNPRMGGGVHNFKRFLENWGGQSLNYTGSLINLYNSRNNNGAFKCCINVYSPPNRNWAFDTSFLDPARLPPGTPFIQSIQLTSFERIND